MCGEMPSKALPSAPLVCPSDVEVVPASEPAPAQSPRSVFSTVDDLPEEQLLWLGRS